MRETAESTKIHIIYGGPARSSKSASSLDECSETGPPSQNKLWSVLARNRFYPVVQAGDLKQWFLQVRTREGERDTMRFHWLKHLETKQAEPLRFTRALYIRDIHITIPSWRSYRSAPVKPSAELPKRSRRSYTEPLC